MGRWRYSFCAVVLLGALPVGCGHPVDPSVVDPFDALRDKFAQTVTVDWDDVPLETVLRELSEQSGVAIRLDAAKLEEADISPAQPVSLRAAGIRFRSVLRLLLDGVEAAYVWQDDGLTITSLEEALAQRVGRIYATADVTRDQQSLDEEKLAEVIREIVVPDSWEDAGGSGNVEVRPGALFIQQTWSVHEQIDDLLAALRSQVGAGQAPGGHSSPATEAILRALDTRVTLDINRPPATVLRELAAQHGINVVVRWSKLAQYDVDEAALRSRAREETAPIVLTDVSLRLVLDLLLEPLGVRWAVRDEVLLVTTQDEGETSLSLRIYDVPSEIRQRRFWRPTPPLLTRPFSRGYLTNDVEEFADDLTYLIQPSSWQDAGGPGVLCPVAQHLLVSQTQRVHDELAACLDQFRRARDPRAIDYDERATSPQAARLWQLLDQPVSVDLGEHQLNLRQALDHLSQRYGLANILIEEKCVLDADIVADVVYPDLRVTNISLAAVLDLVADAAGLGWVVRDNVVVVTSKERTDTMLVNLAYRCPALSEPVDDESIMDVVNNTLAPNSWQEAGGPGCDECLFGDVLSVSQTWFIHRQLRRFLEQWNASLGAKADAPPCFAFPPAEQRLWHAAQRHVSYSCQNCELSLAVAELAQRAGVENIIWDWPTIQEQAGPRDAYYTRRKTDRLGTFTATDEPLGDALTRLLEPRQLAWTIRHDVLWVTSQENAELHSIAGFYRVPLSPVEMTGYASWFGEIVTEHLRPDSWQDAGGGGTLEFVSDNAFAVGQTSSVHRELQLFLRQFRASIGPVHGGDSLVWQRSSDACPRLVVSPTEQALLAAVNRPVTYAVKDGPFPEVLAALAKLGGVKLTLDAPGIDDPTIPDLAQTRVSLDVTGEPLSNVLTGLAEAHGLRWVPRHDHILVTRNEPDRPITGFYRVSQNALDLFEAATLLAEVAFGFLEGEDADPVPAADPAAVPGPDPFGGPVPWSVEDDLHEMLVELLGPPERWADDGGLGRLTIVPLEGRQGAVVALTHTAATHSRARQLLEGWEKAPALPKELLKLLNSSSNDQPLRQRKRRTRSYGPLISIIPIVG